ncbi:uncharacterized protein gtsf1 isoform X1 [Stigmatopora nigra]
MATIKFGSSIEASCQAHVKVSTLNEELVDNDDTNPARLVPCPFDKSHQIRICRFPYHIIKCKKNHPQLAKQMKTCSFNACHVMPKHELDEHTKTCPNRIALFTEEVCRQMEARNVENGSFRPRLMLQSPQTLVKTGKRKPTRQSFHLFGVKVHLPASCQCK